MTGGDHGAPDRRDVPRLWGRGYATEASQAIKIHALTSLSRERLVALIHPDNQASAQRLKRVFAIDIGLSSRRIPGKRSDAVARVARRQNRMD